MSVGGAFAFFYIVVVSWALWYLLASFEPDLAWGRCDNDFNTHICHAAASDSRDFNSSEIQLRSSTEEYWNHFVLGVEASGNFVRKISYVYSTEPVQFKHFITYSFSRVLQDGNLL